MIGYTFDDNWNNATQVKYLLNYCANHAEPSYRTIILWNNYAFPDFPVPL